MAGIGEAASIVGVVAFGFQTAQILQMEIDAVLHADQRVQQTVIEISATAHFLNDLNQYLAAGSKVSRRTKREYEIIIHQCNIVFRRVIVLVAKAGSKVLASVDEYQMLISRGEDPKTLELQIKLCKLESLSWPWKTKKIEQCLVDMARLKQGLNDRLTIAHAAQAQGRPLNEDSDSFDEGGVNQEEEAFDYDSMQLPVVEVVEHIENSLSHSNADQSSSEEDDHVIFNRRRRLRPFGTVLEKQRNRCRQKEPVEPVSVVPPVDEMIDIIGYGGSEASSRYNSPSDTSSYSHDDTNCQGSHGRRPTERRPRIRHRDTVEVRSRQSCTIS